MPLEKSIPLLATFVGISGLYLILKPKKPFSFEEETNGQIFSRDSETIFENKEAEIIGEHRFLVSLLQNYYCLKHPEKVSFTRVKIRESDQALSFSWQTEQFSRQFYSALNDLTQGKTMSMPDIFELVS